MKNKLEIMKMHSTGVSLGHNDDRSVEPPINRITIEKQLGKFHRRHSNNVSDNNGNLNISNCFFFVIVAKNVHKNKENKKESKIE